MCKLTEIRLAEDYNLEQQYRKPFLDVWKEEKDDRTLGPLSEKMGVRERGGGSLLVSDEEMGAASMKDTVPRISHDTDSCASRFLPCLLLL